MAHTSLPFFTVNLLERRRRLLVEHIDILRVAFRVTQTRLPFENVAIVILPDHLHCVWRLPAGDDDYSNRWSQIKSQFLRKLEITEYRSKIRSKNRERAIWQRRFWEHSIIDADDPAHHVNYVYINPLKHGYVTKVCHWPYSSFHRDVRRGIYPEDWAG